MLSGVKIKKIKKELSFDDNQLSMIFNALGDTSRFQIFRILLRHKDICVSDIAKILNISVPAASQQLRIMEMLGIVKRIRMGQMICYEIKKENSAVKSLIALL